MTADHQSPRSTNGKTGPALARKFARSASLRYVSDESPGITRQSRGRGFGYFGPRGGPIRNITVLRRIEKLVIPPAWTDVWVCPLTNGHIQAIGRDARGRKQYLYHRRWAAVRDEAKFERMAAFGALLPRIRRRVSRDLRLPGLPMEKILATIVRLLETTMIRVGNEEYARTNHSFGLTTFRNRHAAVRGPQIQFRFRGKSGKHHNVEISDPRVARTVRRCQDLPGQELFQYMDDNHEPHSIDSADVNDYLRSISGEEITAKDFRTWAGTCLAAELLCTRGEVPTKTLATQAVREAVQGVADQLGNTVSICRKSYIHPAILAGYLDASLLKTPFGKSFHAHNHRGRRRGEKLLVKLLQQGFGQAVKS